MKGFLFVRFYVLVVLLAFVPFAAYCEHLEDATIARNSKIGQVLDFQNIIDENGPLFDISVEFMKGGKLEKHTVNSFKQLEIGYFDNVDEIFFRPVNISKILPANTELTVKWYLQVGGEVIRFDDYFCLSSDFIDALVGGDYSLLIETVALCESKSEKQKRQRVEGKSAGGLYF